MAATFIIAAMLAQATATVGDRVDVGYEQLAQGEPAAAIERIDTNEAIAKDDPAALINKGAAYARLGEKDKAADCYRAAIASPQRYDLQLGDGSWMDSRRLAREALAALTRGDRLAAR
jgi:Tfp pilus assembly protein PilF